MNTKHTPGPWVGVDPKTKKFRKSNWYADNERANATVSAPIKAGRATVAMVVSEDWDKKDEYLANARLIAAAPEMLAALQSIAEYWNRDHNETAMADACWHAIETALAAIAKATGEPQ